MQVQKPDRSSIVLETDAPDIPPSWLPEGSNTPAQLPKIGAVLAELRNLSLDEVAQATTANAMHIMPMTSCHQRFAQNTRAVVC